MKTESGTDDLYTLNLSAGTEEILRKVGVSSVDKLTISNKATLSSVMTADQVNEVESALWARGLRFMMHIPTGHEEYAACDTSGFVERFSFLRRN